MIHLYCFIVLTTLKVQPPCITIFRVLFGQHSIHLTAAHGCQIYGVSLNVFNNRRHALCLWNVFGMKSYLIFIFLYLYIVFCDSTQHEFPKCHNVV